MGNSIASSFVESLRRSLSGTTLVSKTSAEPPIFSDPTSLPGVAKAWVKFNGIQSPNTICTILNKSTNVAGVTCRGVGEYQIGFVNNTFIDTNYIIAGSVTSKERFNLLSAANNFFIMDSGYKPGVVQSNNEFRIQTIYSTASSGAPYTGPSYANTVNLLIYK